MRKRSIQVPEEIIEEVLYRLPPKALLRFKSVCKSWRSRISNPDFIENHLNKSSDFAHQNLILTHATYAKHPVLCLKSASLQSILDCAPNNVMGTTTILDYSRMDPGHGCLQIYGSCNGLVLLTTESQRSVLLWNPSTRKARNLLTLNGRSFISERTVYGFGYNGDYKIVCIYPWSMRWIATGCYATQIYSLRNHSWREIENFYEGCTPVADSGKFVNGRLHWIATKYDKDGAYIWNIVCLDLGAEEDERYEMVPKPDCLLSESCCYPHCLRVFGGNLGLACYMNDMSNMNIWVMKEYGVRESWVNILNISSLCERYRGPWGRLLSPFRLGDSVLIFGSSLIFYDGQNNLHDIQTDVVRESAEAYAYVESLVSPFGDGEEEPPNIASDLLSSWLGLDRPSSVSVRPSYEFHYEWSSS